MLHTWLIVLHSIAGVASFAAGVASLRLRAPGSWRFRVYLGSLAAMLAFVAGAIAVSWGGLGAGERLVFAGLSGLGLYMVWRAGRAHTRLRRQDRGWRPKYLDDVGFTLISLFAGFVIVGAIDLGLPVWLVVLAAVGGVTAGIQAMKKVKTRLAAQQPVPRRTGQGHGPAGRKPAVAEDVTPTANRAA